MKILIERDTNALSIVCADEAAMQALAARLATYCSAPAILYFSGELGAGKTTLIRAFLRKVGVTGAIKSPTFTLLEPYTVGDCHFYHFDLYRLKQAAELEYIGIRDYFREDAICLLEWPEKGEACLPPADLQCNIVQQGQGRKVAIQAHSAKGHEIIGMLT